MERRTLGKTGIEVTRLGFGGARIGLDHATQDQANDLLNGLLDSGINFIDTASGYLESERMIGEAIAQPGALARIPVREALPRDLQTRNVVGR